MKRQTVMLLTGITVAAMLATGCQSGNNTEDTTSLYGEVTEIDGDNITIALGEEPKQPEKPEKPEEKENDSQDENSETDEAAEDEANKEENPQEPPSNEIELTGEEKTITVDDDTEVLRISGGMEEAPIEDLQEGDIISVEMDGSQVVSIKIQSMGMGGDMSGSSTGSIALTGVYTVDNEEKTSEDESYTSEAEDENAVLVTNEGALTMSGASLTKTGDTSSEDESNFYGVNAVLAATEGGSVKLSDITIESSAEGANAVFSTGENSSITIDKIKINTTGNSSRGLDATYGGSIVATNVDITTEGAHCASIATDRGEGTVTVDGGTLKASGEGSPCIYSTGNITVKNITGTATGSQAAVVEGKNSIILEKCDLTGTGENGIMLYQSTSGDAAEGTAKFSATDSTITSQSDGAMFYITNTEAEAALQNTTLNMKSGILIQASGNSTNNWGKEGENGGDFVLKASNQKLTGDILCDEISTVNVELTEESILKGTINGDKSGKEVRISLDENSSWEVTGDSCITSITDEDESLKNIISNGYSIYYDSSDSANEWLNGQTIALDDGGELTPME